MTLMTMRSGTRGARAPTTARNRRRATQRASKPNARTMRARRLEKARITSTTAPSPAGIRPIRVSPFGSRRSGLAVRDMPVWDAPVRIHPFVRRAFGPCLFGQHAFSAPNIEIPMPPSSHSAHRILGSHGECASDWSRCKNARWRGRHRSIKLGVDRCPIRFPIHLRRSPNRRRSRRTPQ